MRVFAQIALWLLIVVAAINANAQPVYVPPPLKPPPKALIDSLPDSNFHVRAHPDSARMLDSIYAVRRREIEARLARTGYVPQQDFMSVRIGAAAFGRIKAPDLQEYFAERSGRPDPKADREDWAGLDRYLALAGEAMIGSSWGIYLEYSYAARYFNTLVAGSVDPTVIPNGEKLMDLSTHTFVTGPFIIPLETKFFRTKLYAGIGPAFTGVEEQEGTTFTRSSSATGYALSFEAEFDFRIIDQLSFGIGLLTRQQQTGRLTSSDKSLSERFGQGTLTTKTEPEASFLFGALVLGVHWYF